MTRLKDNAQYKVVGQHVAHLEYGRRQASAICSLDSYLVRGSEKPKMGFTENGRN